MIPHIVQLVGSDQACREEGLKAWLGIQWMLTSSSNEVATRWIPVVRSRGVHSIDLKWLAFGFCLDRGVLLSIILLECFGLPTFMLKMTQQGDFLWRIPLQQLLVLRFAFLLVLALVLFLLILFAFALIRLLLGLLLPSGFPIGSMMLVGILVILTPPIVLVVVVLVVLWFLVTFFFFSLLLFFLGFLFFLLSLLDICLATSEEIT
jgi:hypothetical protein